MIENGIRIPRLPMVESLARVLGLSPAYLAFGFELPPPEGDSTGSAGFVARLKDARSLRGATLRELAQSAGIVEGTIRALERATMPQLDTPEALAKALRVSPPPGSRSGRGRGNLGGGERPIPRPASSPDAPPAPQPRFVILPVPKFTA